jgi:hypothetical protein
MKHYALFSRKGFTEEVKRVAGKENILLVGIEDIG